MIAWQLLLAVILVVSMAESFSSELHSSMRSDVGGNGDKIVCYYGGWAVYRQKPMTFKSTDIDPFACTHVIYSFAGLDEATNKIKYLDKGTDIDNGNYQKFVDLKKANQDLKVLIAIGGWNEGSRKYSIMSNSDSKRRAFVNSAVEFLNTYGFDGLDLDWEYPAARGGSPSDKQAFTKLCKELKEAFEPHGWLLTAAVTASASQIDNSYEVEEISKYLDFINVMSYDFHGSWDGFADHHSSLYQRPHAEGNYKKLNTEYALNHWHSKGAPKNKLIVGVPFYGRSFLLKDANNYLPGSNAETQWSNFAGPYTQEQGMIAYVEICEMEKQGGWTVRQDEVGNVYMTKGQKWVGFDSPDVVLKKMNFIKQNGYGGAMTWSIELDDFTGICGEKWPLLKAMKRGLEGAQPSPNPTTSTQQPTNSGSSSTTASTTITTPDSTTPMGPDGNGDTTDGKGFYCPQAGLFPAPRCEDYFSCSGTGYGLETKLTCPPGLLFDEPHGVCNWQSVVQCQ